MWDPYGGEQAQGPMDRGEPVKRAGRGDRIGRGPIGAAVTATLKLDNM